MVLKRFPNGVTWGQQYNIGEKASVILCTYINHHVGTPKTKADYLLEVSSIFGLRVPDDGTVTFL